MILRRGDIGPAVKAMQLQLYNHGWKISADGGWGLQTDAAVRCFQQREQLTPDGLAGPTTLGALAKLPAEEPVMEEPVAVLLKDVPYLSQRDNINKPFATCNVTSIAMVLSFYGYKVPVGGMQLEDYLFEQLQAPLAQQYFKKHYAWAVAGGWHPRNLGAMLQWMVKRLGFLDTYGNVEFHQLYDLLNQGLPIVAAGKFTNSGHFICIVGYTKGGDLIVNDPYGDWNARYHKHQGKHRIYSNQNMMNILSPTDSSKAIIHQIRPGITYA